jgi:hypothetical protein
MYEKVCQQMMVFKYSNFPENLDQGGEINNFLLLSNAVARFLEILNNLLNTFFIFSKGQLVRVFVRFGC